MPWNRLSKALNLSVLQCVVVCCLKKKCANCVNVSWNSIASALESVLSCVVTQKMVGMTGFEPATA